MSQELRETWLTTEAFERRTAELEQLSGEGRAEIARKIEARIRVLTELLRHAKVGDAPENTDVVASGTVVTAKIQGEHEVFLIGSREIVDDDSDLDVWSEGSPLGSAILGQKVGTTTSYTAPNGKEITVEIEKVEPYRVK
jgi:transcription elongation factor GreA